MGPDTDAEPVPLVPRVVSFELIAPGADEEVEPTEEYVHALHVAQRNGYLLGVDASGGGSGGGGGVGSATMLLTFNMSAHRAGDLWRQCHACGGNENVSTYFPAELVFSDPLGIDFSGERERARIGDGDGCLYCNGCFVTAGSPSAAQSWEVGVCARSSHGHK